MYFYGCGLLVIASLSTATLDFRRGWLDRVVEYHKNKLFEDFRKLPAVQIKATVQPAPPGYVDSAGWDYASALRLVTLIRDSEGAAPARRALARALGNRRMMSFQDSFKAFPSLSKNNSNYFYYDMGSELDEDVVPEPSFDDDVIVVSNPVEARLPSAMISVSLLRNILEARAAAARYMPTTRSTIPWSPITKTKTTRTTTAPPASTTASPRDTTAPGTGPTEAPGSSPTVAPPTTTNS